MGRKRSFLSCRIPDHLRRWFIPKEVAHSPLFGVGCMVTAFHAAQGGGRAGSPFTVDKPGELYSGQRHGDESRRQYGPWTGWDRNTLSLYRLLPTPQGLPDKPKSKDNELSDQGFSKLSVVKKKENLGNGQSRGASGERTTECSPGGDPRTTKEGC